MYYLKLNCWRVLVSGFGYGFIERTLAMDLQSVVVATFFLVLVFPLHPGFYYE